MIDVLRRFSAFVLFAVSKNRHDFAIRMVNENSAGCDEDSCEHRT